jgi:hypothetical protein
MRRSQFVTAIATTHATGFAAVNSGDFAEFHLLLLVIHYTAIIAVLVILVNRNLTAVSA